MAFLLQLALASMICGLVILGNGDRRIRSLTTTAHGFISAGATQQDGNLTVAAGNLVCNETKCTCSGGAIDPGDGTKNLAIIGHCTASGGLYQKKVNIYKDVLSGGAQDGGSLSFTDATGAINFWAKSILIQNNGALIAGSQIALFVGPLTIHLYGLEQNKENSGLKGVAIACKTPIVDGGKTTFCGIPNNFWTSNTQPNPDSCKESLAGWRWKNPAARAGRRLLLQLWSAEFRRRRPQRVLRLQGSGRFLWRNPTIVRRQGRDLLRELSLPHQ